MTAESWTLIDCHVHLHPQFDPARLLDAAGDNLHSAAARLGVADWAGILLLTEMAGVDWFGATRARIERGESRIGRWNLRASSEPETLIASDSERGIRLRVVAGRQIETIEKIEVLALMTRHTVPDRMPLEQTLAASHAAGALVVLPWGVGKWLGSRGKLVESALEPRASAPPVFAGDNSGRPWFWPRPAVFATLEKQGLPVLSGTDPLPLSDQAARVGTFGVAFAGNIADDTAAAELKARLLSRSNPQPLRTFGRLERASRFVINQLRLRT